MARLVDRTGCYYPGQWAFGLLGGGFILAYHDLPAEIFERQIAALHPNEPVHLAEIFERARAGRSTTGLFAVTFDDGVAATVRSIAEVCQRRQWPVSFYLPTDYLDRGHGMPFQLWQNALTFLPRAPIRLPSRTLDLSGPEAFARFTGEVDAAMYTQPRDRYAPLIEELVRWLLERELATTDQLRPPPPIPWHEVATLSRHEAIRFESHGVTHTAVVALSPDTLEDELRSSQRRISEHTGRDCRHFCYPYGEMESIGAVAPGIVVRVYDTATTMVRGRLRRHSWSLAPRIPMYDRDHPSVARLKILTV